jgi:3-oxoadipate enol-lactonase
MRIRANGVHLFFHSEGNGPTMAFLHALGLDHSIWEHQFRAFRDRFRVVGIDLRGHGQSDKPAGPYTIEQMAADIAGLLKKADLAPAILVGLSIGGMVAMATAADYPDLVKALVVIAATSEYDASARKIFLQRAMTAESEGMRNISETAPQRWFTSTFLEMAQDEVRHVVQLLERNDPAAYAASCRAVASLDITDKLRCISCPTLIVAGEQDPALPPPVVERLKEHISGARFELVPQASHMVPLEQPVYLNHLLEAFLKDL